MQTNNPGSKIPIPRNASGLMRRHRWAIYIVVLVLIVLAVGSVLNLRHDRALAADKARFVGAENSVAKLSRDIIAVTGQPLKVENTKSCSRPNLKFQEGPLSCDVDTDIFYEIQDNMVANNMYPMINKVIHSKWIYRVKDIPRTTNGDVIVFEKFDGKPAEEKKYQKIIEEYYDDEAMISCTMVYGFYESASPPYPKFGLSTKSKYLLNVALSCGDLAKAQYYPLNE